MMRKFKLIIASLSVLGVLFLPAVHTSAASKPFNIFNPPTCDPNGKSDSDSVCCKTDERIKTSPVCAQANDENSSKQNPAVSIINTAANIIALVAGIAAVVVIIASGFNLITSAGNQEQTKISTRRILYASAGLVVIALAWVIISFVISKFLT